MDTASGQHPIRVRIASITAHCPSCGGEQFLSRELALRAYSEILVCLACGEETPRWRLVDQIAAEVERRAEEVLGMPDRESGPDSS